MTNLAMNKKNYSIAVLAILLSSCISTTAPDTPEYYAEVEYKTVNKNIVLNLETNPDLNCPTYKLDSMFYGFIDFKTFLAVSGIEVNDTIKLKEYIDGYNSAINVEYDRFTTELGAVQGYINSKALPLISVQNTHIDICTLNELMEVNKIDTVNFNKMLIQFELELNSEIEKRNLMPNHTQTIQQCQYGLVNRIKSVLKTRSDRYKFDYFIKKTNWFIGHD